MNLRVLTHTYPHVKNLITKIIYLTRLIMIPEGDIILYTKSNKLKFVIFVATLLSNKCLYIVSSLEEIVKTYTENRIGILFTNELLDKIYKKVPLSIMLSEEILFSSSTDFEFGDGFLAKNYAHLLLDCGALANSSFKDERETFGDRWENTKHIHWNTNVLHMNGITYNNDNIRHMLNAVDSEFGDENHLFVSLSEIEFKQSFIYMLYFFLRGQLTNIGKSSLIYNMLLNSDRKLKRIVFMDNNNFNEWWHDLYKYEIYSYFNIFLGKWKLTKWITRFTYDRILHTKNPHAKHELILMNLDRSLDKEKFLDQAHTNVSIIYGTPADGYTLGINRYTDKKLKIENNSFRVIDKGNTIDIQKDTINRLLIGGTRVPEHVKKIHPIQSKKQNELYYISDLYCEIDGEIFTIKANSEDLYFQNEGNIIIDTGTKRRSLMAIPYLKRVDVLKVEEKFIAVVEIDKDFIKKTWENPKLTYVKIHLNSKIEEMNNDFDNSERIDRIIVSKRFFKEMDEVSHIITKKNFIKYLNRKPFNYLN